MTASLAMIAADFFTVAGLAGAGYQLVAAFALRRFRAAGQTAVAAAPTLPPVTILKPLCGDEPELSRNLRSFVDQTYPSVQVVFGVRSESDPAIGVVRRLIAERPESDLSLVIEAGGTGANRKVANLINMLPAARHDILVIADSDMRVAPDYLHQIVRPLVSDERIGLVTCLYSARAGAGQASRFGAAGVNYGFLPLALVGWLFGVDKGSFGATLALRRRDLDAIGGFAPLADVLADDYELGAALRRRGLAIALPAFLIETTAHEPNLKALWRHELRWARTLRLLAPAGYAASQISQATVLAVIGLLIALASGGDARFSAGAFGLAVVARLVLVRSADRLVTARALPVWLLPFRDILSAAVSVASFCGNRIAWRGKTFHIDRDGRLVPDKEVQH